MTIEREKAGSSAQNGTTRQEMRKLYGEYPNEQNAHRNDNIRSLGGKVFDEILRLRGGKINERALTDFHFNEAADHELLSKDEEVALAKRVERGIEAQKQFAETKSEKKRESLRNDVESGWAARETLILSNIKLVISVANKQYRKRKPKGVSFNDLIQAGSVGLIRAVPKYDWRKGHRFSTYATWWIRQSVQKEITYKARAVRLPVWQQNSIIRMKRRQKELAQTLGRQPEIEELAEYMDVKVERIEELNSYDKPIASLDNDVESGEDTEFINFIVDDEADGPSKKVEDEQKKEELRSAIESVLSPRESKIIYLRYGLNGSDQSTIRVIGKMFGISRERVRQIEEEALKKLRYNEETRRKLKEYLS